MGKTVAKKRPSLADLRKHFKEEKQQKTRNSGGNSTDIFPFWNMEVNESARVRFLPDENVENPNIFFVDRYDHKITINGKNRKVVCRQTFNEPCPICELSQKFYSEEGKGSERGKYYWRSKTSLARVVVLDSPIKPDSDELETYEGGVFNVQLGYQLMTKIDEQVTNEADGLEADPWDAHDGYDFIIKKTPQGEWGNYQVGSTFARKNGPLPDDLIEVFEEGIIDLSTLLPEDKGYDYVQTQLNAHLTGEDADEDDDGDDDGMSEKLKEKIEALKKDKETKTSKPKTEKVTESAPVEDDEDADAEEEDDDDDDDDDEDDLMAQIAARAAAKRKKAD